MEYKTTSVRRDNYYPNPIADNIVDKLCKEAMSSEIERMFQELIGDKIDDITEPYHNKNYAEINKILFKKEDFVFKAEYTPKQTIQCILLMCGSETNNIKIFELVMDENDDDIPKLLIESGSLLKINNEIFVYVLEHIRLTDTFLHHVFDKNKIDIKCFKFLLERGIEIDWEIFEKIIKNNNIDIIKYLIEENYDIQSLYDTMIFVDIDLSEMNLDTFKFLHQNIRTEKHICHIFRDMIKGHDLEAVEFLVDSFIELDLNTGFNMACGWGDVNIMKYLSEKGAGIKNKDEFVVNYSFDTVKFLIENGHNYPHINWEIRKAFANDADLTNVKWLLQYGTMDLVFESNYDHRKYRIDFTKEPNSYHFLVCIMEYTISMNRMSHLEFLVENHFDQLRPELTRLFVVACSNGRLEMAKFLLKSGAEIHEQSMISACYFGHIHIINFLLEMGLQFDEIKSVNLFETLFNTGLPFAYDIDKNPYEKIIVNENNMLRNDIYYNDNCFINNKKYTDIVRLLINHNVDVKNYNYAKHCRKGLLEMDIINYFLPSININEEIKNKYTIIEQCVNFNKYDIAKFFLDYGAKPEITDERLRKLLLENTKMYDLFKEYGYI